jgi:hypothetical protein
LARPRRNPRAANDKIAAKKRKFASDRWRARQAAAIKRFRFDGDGLALMLLRPKRGVMQHGGMFGERIV